MKGREFDYAKITYFTMVSDGMDDGSIDSISKGDTMVCVPINVGDLNSGDIVVVMSSGKMVIGVVDNVGKGFVSLSRYNPRYGKVRIPTRLSRFYLVLESRRKRDGVTIGLMGLA